METIQVCDYCEREVCDEVTPCCGEVHNHEENVPLETRSEEDIGHLGYRDGERQ